ncbi:MAG TPA: ferric reductase-like transmembrane domain-containing protein [Patescibacteria group bacterium]|nr:ferric reductase-like transmembrane domain-containing protein [Patescibacteria group bacterium]
MSNKGKIINLFVCAELIVFTTLIIGAFAVFTHSPAALLLTQVGRKLGTLSVWLLSLTLLPGILRRLQMFTTVRVILMLFRRHFGILMYWTAITHGLFMFGLQALASGSWTVNAPILMGILAVLVSFPLLLTSNDMSVRLLKGWWNTLHKLVYVTLFFATLHTLTMNPGLGAFLMTFLFLELLSYIVAWIHDHTLSRG